MSEWEKAKKQLDNTEFPNLLFNNYFNDNKEKDFNGIVKQDLKHKLEKREHKASKVKINSLFKVNGYPVEATRTYCFDCKRSLHERMVIFNNKDNVCYIKEQSRLNEQVSGDYDVGVFSSKFSS